MHRKTDWQALLTPQLVYSLAWQKCREASRNFSNMNKPEHHRTDPLQGREVADILLFMVRNVCIIARATLGRLLRDGATCLSWCYNTILIRNWKWKPTLSVFDAYANGLLNCFPCRQAEQPFQHLTKKQTRQAFLSLQLTSLFRM